MLLGRRRFRLESLVTAPTGGESAAYAVGVVRWLDEGEPGQRTFAAHAAAAHVGLGVQQRQQLLEIDDPDERDRVVATLVREEEALQRAFGARPIHQPSDAGLN